MPGYVSWFRDFNRDNHGWARVGVQLLSEQVDDPELMQPVRDWYREVKERVAAMPEEKRGPVMTAVLAMEGIFFIHKFDLDTMAEEEKERVLEYILNALAPSPAIPKDSGAA